MKRFITLMLGLTICLLSLTACGKDSDEKKKGLKSKIEGVSDEAYTAGMEIVDKLTDKEYMKTVSSEISDIAERELSNWEQIPGNELDEKLESLKCMKDMNKKIDSIPSKDEDDDEFSEDIRSLYYLWFDVMWGKAVEDTSEGSSMFKSMLSVYKYLDEKYEKSPFENSSEVFKLGLEDIKSKTKVIDLSYLALYSEITIARTS